MSKYSLGERVSARVESSQFARAVVEDAPCSRRASRPLGLWWLRLSTLLLSIMAAIAAPAAATAQNLVSNGNFLSLPGLNPGLGTSCTATNWTTTGFCGQVGGAFSNLYTVGFAEPGNNAYWLTGLGFGGGPVTNTQTVSVTHAGLYMFGFGYANGCDPTFCPPSSFSVSVGGNTATVTTNVSANPTFTQFSEKVALTAGPTAIVFANSAGTWQVSIDDVSLTCLTGCPLSSPQGLPTNQTNASNGINNFINGGGVLPTTLQNLPNLSPSQLQTALTQLDGEAASDAEKGAFALMDQFLALMLDPFVDGRFANGEKAIGFAPDQQASFPPDVALAYASVLKAAPAAAAASPFAQRWTTWGAGFGASSTTVGNAAIGSNIVAVGDYGFAGGMDYHITPDTAYGFALAGGGTNWNLAQGLGSGRSDNLQVGIYSSTHFGPAYLAAALAFSNNWFSTNRTALGDDITSSFAGQGYGGRVEAGYRYAVPVSGTVIGTTPYAAIQTQWFHTPTYSETDLAGGGLGLTYNAMTANDTRSELGARFDDPTLLNGMPLILRARLAWAHDWVSNTSLDAVFQSLPGSSFIVNGATPPKDSALASVGARLYFSRAWSFAAKFDGEFASGSQTYGGTGTLRYTW
jgi:uncharacterized protein with beta-barrel porin domain